MSLRSVCIFFRFSAIAFDAQIRDDVSFSVVCPRFIYQTDAMEMVFDSQNYYTKANILSLSHSVYLVSTHFGFGSLTMQRRLYVCVRRRQGQKWHYHFIYRPKVIHNWNVSISSCFFFVWRETKREQHLKLYHSYILNLNAIEYVYFSSDFLTFHETAVSPSLRWWEIFKKILWVGFCVHKLVINLIHIIESKW